jgi:hypothetical protein
MYVYGDAQCCVIVGSIPSIDIGTLHFDLIPLNTRIIVATDSDINNVLNR